MGIIFSILVIVKKINIVYYNVDKSICQIKINKIILENAPMLNCNAKCVNANFYLKMLTSINAIIKFNN